MIELTKLTNFVTLPFDFNSIASYNQVPMYMMPFIFILHAHNLLLYYMGMSIDVKVYAPDRAVGRVL